MCIAALLKPGADVTDDTLRKMFNANRNGVGIGYIKQFNGKPEVCIEKGLFSSEDWIRKFRTVRTLAGRTSPIVLHARIATLGRVSKDNCHPFHIKKGLLAHNGSMWSARGGHSAVKSDTREFADRLFNNLNYDDIMVDKGHIEKSLGWNKVIILFDDLRYVILNEGNGSWENDVWYSNTNFKSAFAASCEVQV